jgi:diguanylate cyclase (GGDEF)-like protein/PAS domain S-box-containing protein
MFGKRSGRSKVHLLLVNDDIASNTAARKAIEDHGLHFTMDVADDGTEAAKKLSSKQYDCLLVDPDVVDYAGLKLGELLAAAGPEAALVVLCHSQRRGVFPGLKDLKGVTFLDSESLRRPDLVDKLSECLEVSGAMRSGEVDALLIPTAGTREPLLAPGSDSIYRVLVERLEEGILTADSEGTILFTNCRTGQILGCDPDRLLGLGILALANLQDQPWFRDKIDGALGGATPRCELALACPGQAPVNVLVSLAPIGDIGGADGVCVALTDISEEKRLRDELQRLATIDPLTALYNRRYLAESLEKECRRVSRYGRPLSCLMMDIDEFKACNDLHGHLAGDELLRRIAALVRGSVRDTDIVARYGGEEFCVLLPETPYERAMQCAERIRSAIADEPLSVRERPAAITVSIGVWASGGKENLEPDTILARADAALMEAKAAGKNRVCGHPTSAHTGA